MVSFHSLAWSDIVEEIRASKCTCIWGARDDWNAHSLADGCAVYDYIIGELEMG